MKKLLVCISFLVILLGCRAADGTKSYKESSTKSVPIDKTGETLKNAEEGVGQQNASDKKKFESEQAERKRIKTGSINYNVSDLKSTEKVVTEKVKEYGGYVVSTNFTLNTAVIQVKIPYDRFDDFLLVTGNFGKITSKNMNVEDVTMEYYDLENRIKNKKILQSRFQNYLSNARNTEELLKIETELNRVTEEIESLEGNFKNLSHLVQYSTLTLNFYVPGTDIEVKVFPSIKKGFEDFGFVIVNFFYGVLFFILYFIIFIIPTVLIAGLIYLFTFGKIGLVRRLFKSLSGKKKQT
jgi:hypothetical protein